MRRTQTLLNALSDGPERVNAVNGINLLVRRPAMPWRL